MGSVRSFALKRGKIFAIFHFEGKTPESILPLIIIARETEIIGAASFRSLQEILSRPVAL